MSRGRFPVLLALSLLGSAFSVPSGLRVRRGYGNNELDSSWNRGYKDLEAASSENRKVRQEDEPKDNTISEKDATTETEPSKVNLSPSTEESKNSYPPPSPYNDDDDSDEDEDFNVTQPASGGGSSIFSLLKLANALFPGSSSSNIRIRSVLRKLLIRYQDVLKINRHLDSPVSNNKFMRRIDTIQNEIDDSYIADLKPPAAPFEKQEIEESDSDENDTESDETNEDDSESDLDTNEDDDDNISQKPKKDQDNAAEESVENNDKDNEKESKSKQETSNGDDGDDDYSEEPESDGQGGGILGILAGLSGGEDGQSDLGSLLATVGGIVANLSGDGIDINALIASGLGLFVGLLSEGEENPGAVIASYLLTSLDTLTGGGAQNNGAFFGTFISKLIKGTSAVPEGSSEEEGNGMPMSDSAGFLFSLIMGLLGDMSKGSSGGSSHR